jgi:hypothetical protein
MSSDTHVCIGCFEPLDDSDTAICTDCEESGIVQCFMCSRRSFDLICIHCESTCTGKQDCICLRCSKQRQEANFQAEAARCRSIPTTNDTRLHELILSGCSAVELQQRLQSDPSLRDALGKKNQFDKTPLSCAVITMREDLVEFLLDVQPAEPITQLTLNRTTTPRISSLLKQRFRDQQRQHASFGK